MMKNVSTKIGALAFLSAAFAASSGAQAPASAQEDIYLRYPDITGPFQSAEYCVIDTVQSVLGKNAELSFADDAEDESKFVISAYSAGRDRQIFVTMKDGKVVELGINLESHWGWADMYYGAKSSVLKIGAAKALSPEGQKDINDFTLNVDEKLRYCGAAAASAGPAPAMAG